MNRSLRRWSGLWLLAWLFGWIAPPVLSASIQVTDDRGVTLRFAAPPQRIVSMLPSLTESVCALGACSRLVGVDRYSNWPASVEKLPRLGGLDDALIEAIVALRPEVVLASTSAQSLDRQPGHLSRLVPAHPEGRAHRLPRSAVYG